MIKKILPIHQEGKLFPQEEMLEIARSKESLTIGIPKETSYQERRIALTPASVSVLVNNGHEVIIENNAGQAAHFNNHAFTEAGGKIVYNTEEIYKSNIILKVAPPSIKELNLFEGNQTIISALHVTDQDEVYFRKLIEKKINAISFENIKDRSDSFPIRRAMSEIVGSASVLIGAEYLSNNKYGKGIMLGGFPGIKPTEVVIIGGGTVAQYAANAALGFGASIKIFDNDLFKLRDLQKNLSSNVYTSILQPVLLERALQYAQIVIGALHTDDGKTQCVVTEDMVQKMKAGSVIVDVSIDQGGCFETSNITDHNNPVFSLYGVTHYCVPNIASRIPHTASYALSNYLTPILLNIGESGGIDKVIKDDHGLRQGVYIYKGILTNKYISDIFNIQYQNLELLLAAFH